MSLRLGALNPITILACLLNSRVYDAKVIRR